MKYAQPKRIRKAKITNKDYQVEWRDKTKGDIRYLGMIELGNFDDLVLTLNPKQGSKQLVCTTIHEFLHPVLPTARENKIDNLAQELTELLWKMGFRLKK